MSCHDDPSLVIDHYFGELDPEQSRAVEAHLGTCAACWQEYLAVKRSVEFVEEQAEPGVRPDERMQRRLRKAVRQAYGRSIRDLLSVRIPAYAVLIAAALVTAVTLAIATLRTPASEPRGAERGRIASVEDAATGAAPKVIAEYFDSTRTGSIDVF